MPSIPRPSSGNNLATHHHATNMGSKLIDSITSVPNTAYYMFMGVHVPLSNTSNLSLSDTGDSTYKDCYRNMIQGKRITQHNANLMIRNIPYQTNFAFDMYDDSLDLSDLDYYAIVNAGSFFHVYKVLDNNMGANSTAQPDFAQITGANTQVYQTSDGYRWKYMYTVPDTVVATFGTSEFFPLVPNTSVQAASQDGTLDIIKVEGTGRGYNNYLNGTFASQDITVNGNTLLYALSPTSTSTVNGFYTGCLIYVSSGTGAGSYARIIDYFSNGNGNFIEIDSPFQTAPLNGSQYQIYPEVVVVGSGSETTNVVARALVNSLASNSIYRVEVINQGADYNYFVANAVANGVVGVGANAILRPIYPPFGGHGYDPASELLAEQVCFSMRFSNSEANTILTTNQFQQIGILKDPLFANVNLKLDGVSGTFLLNEPVYKVTPVLLDAAANVSTSSNVVTCATANFQSQLQADQNVYLVSNDELDYCMVKVTSVLNATAIQIASNSLFSCTSTTIYAANESSKGYVLSLDAAANLFITNVSGLMDPGDTVIGYSSGCKATVNAVYRNDVTRDFDTFIQLYKYAGTLHSGSFQENEIVYQSNISTSNASLHSTVVNGSDITLYTSNQVGIFDVLLGRNIVGNTSAAIATPSLRYSPELVFGSGQVIYIENISPGITRQATQSETLKIIFEF